MTNNTIGTDGCACGDYQSDNLIAHATCRKSGGSPECSYGVAHILKYLHLNDDGLTELGGIINRMLDFGADCVVVAHEDTLTITNFNHH